MKKIVLLIVLALCVCLSGCKGRQGQTDSAATNADSVPATTAVSALQPTEPENTQPASDSTLPSSDTDMTNEGTSDSINVPGPNEIPGPPDADYTLPPGERPGNSVTEAPKS